jgi:hypothetical protein
VGTTCNVVSPRKALRKNYKKCDQVWRTWRDNLISPCQSLIYHFHRSICAWDWVQANRNGTTAQFKTYFDSLSPVQTNVCMYNCISIYLIDHTKFRYTKIVQQAWYIHDFLTEREHGNSGIWGGHPRYGQNGAGVDCSIYFNMFSSMRNKLNFLDHPRFIKLM